MRYFWISFSFALYLFLSGCTYQEDPRAMASNEIELTFDGLRCQPYESFIPMGEEIELTLINNSDQLLAWYLIFLPFEGDFENQDPENILATFSSPANEESTYNFQAPYLPGKYSSFCVADDDFDNLALTYILVVQPYQENSQP